MPADQTTPDGDVWKGLQAGTADVVRQLEQEITVLKKWLSRIERHGDQQSARWARSALAGEKPGRITFGV